MGYCTSTNGKAIYKKETFEKMGLVSETFTDTPQISGTFIVLRNTGYSTRFVQEWLNFCCDEDILSPVIDLSNEYIWFYEHREDQSILSLLVKKYKIRSWSDPSQYGRLPEKYIRPGCEMIYYGREDYAPFI